MKILEAIETNQVQFTCRPEDIGVLDLKEEAVCCVDEIVDRLAMAQSSVSQHLKELHNAGLLQRHKKAQWVYYTIDRKVLEQLIDYLHQFAPRV
ncbi:MAG: helix-turn-helix transcriptional regulator [Candidatus Hydrogenedentota bacterium]|nr:MAG: helix-turn-helix transcriptional regulator [Candidatus Hydrogenedentota bacterium]